MKDAALKDSFVGPPMPPDLMPTEEQITKHNLQRYFPNHKPKEKESSNKPSSLESLLGEKDNNNEEDGDNFKLFGQKENEESEQKKMKKTSKLPDDEDDEEDEEEEEQRPKSSIKDKSTKDEAKQSDALQNLLGNKNKDSTKPNMPAVGGATEYKPQTSFGKMMTLAANLLGRGAGLMMRPFYAGTKKFLQQLNILKQSATSIKNPKDLPSVAKNLGLTAMHFIPALPFLPVTFFAKVMRYVFEGVPTKGILGGISTTLDGALKAFGQPVNQGYIEAIIMLVPNLFDGLMSGDPKTMAKAVGEVALLPLRIVANAITTYLEMFEPAINIVMGAFWLSAMIISKTYQFGAALVMTPLYELGKTMQKYKIREQAKAITPTPTKSVGESVSSATKEETHSNSTPHRTPHEAKEQESQAKKYDAQTNLTSPINARSASKSIADCAKNQHSMPLVPYSNATEASPPTSSKANEKPPATSQTDQSHTLTATQQTMQSQSDETPKTLTGGTVSIYQTSESSSQQQYNNGQKSEQVVKFNDLAKKPSNASGSINKQSVPNKTEKEFSTNALPATPPESDRDHSAILIANKESSTKTLADLSLNPKTISTQHSPAINATESLLPSQTPQYTVIFANEATAKNSTSPICTSKQNTKALAILNKSQNKTCHQQMKGIKPPTQSPIAVY